LAVGGTSCGAPFCAALLGLLRPSTFAGGQLYAKYASSRAAFHDLTIGSNDNVSALATYNSGTGFDLVTGLGSVAGSLLSPLV